MIPIGLPIFWIMFSRSMKIVSCFSSKTHVTKVTWIGENIGKMLTLNMVSGTGADFVRKIFADSTVKLSIRWILSNVPQKFTWILKIKP